MRDEDRAWLKELQNELWRYVRQTYNYRDNSYWTEKRGFAPEEWERLTKLFDEQLESGEGLVFQLGTKWGFTLMLRVYEDAPVPDTPPEFLLFFDQKQIPPEYGTTGPTGGGTEVSWHRAWEILTKWSHSDRNAQKLKFYGMEPPREQSYYDY